MGIIFVDECKNGAFYEDIWGIEGKGLSPFVISIDVPYALGELVK